MFLRIRTITLTIVLVSVFVISAYSDETQESTAAESPEASETAVFEFGMGLGFGVQTFINPEYNSGTGDPENYTYQSLKLAPEVRFGKLGIGLDLVINYTFAGDHNQEEGFTVRQEDWVPSKDGESLFALYLQKIRYISWGQPSDPLYILFGGMPSTTLGNGFIVGGYSNTVLRPDRRFLGLQVNLDGSLFDFPLIGVQAFTGNTAYFDVFGTRVFFRPLLATEHRLLSSFQLGITAAFDRDPYYIATTTPMSPYHGSNPADQPDDDAFVAVLGADVRQPLLNAERLSLAAFTDVVIQDQAVGSMVGLGGRALKIIPYTAQLRFIGSGFQPVYFDQAYDLYRIKKHQIYSGSEDSPGYIGWLAGTGFSILQDALTAMVTLSGPFPTAGGAAHLPELEGSISLGEDIIPGITAQAHYQKKEIGHPADLLSPKNALIGARINYRTGPAVISLIYDVRYDPYSEDDSPWVVTSGLETTISLE